MSMKFSPKIPIFIVCGKSPLSSFGGGYSTYALNLARIISSIGYKAFIISVGKENKKVELEFATLLTFKSFFFDFRTTALPSLPLASYIFSKHIENLVKENHYDKFIVWGIGPWGLAGLILKKKFKERAVFLNNYFTTIKHEWKGSLKVLFSNDYGILPKIKFFLIYYTIVQVLSFFERGILKYADTIITNYNSTEKILIDELHINSSKLARMTFLTNIYERQAEDKKETKSNPFPEKYILYLSRHDPRKGINYLLHAIKILKDSNKLKMPVIIAGRGELWEANKKVAEKLNISDCVKFIGFVNNPKPLLKNASIFCFPTVEEGAGALIINEAMSLGVPIISTRCDGIPEDIINRESGILVKPQNSQQLADAIEELINNRNLAKKLGRNAKKRYRKLFSNKKMRIEVQRIIQKFI